MMINLTVTLNLSKPSAFYQKMMSFKFFEPDHEFKCPSLKYCGD